MVTSSIKDVSALYGLASLQKTSRSLSQSLEKLATGRRINRGADDAAGMTIADSLESQKRGYAQAIRNTVDAIALVQTADGAMAEMGSIIQDIRTKALQAGSASQSPESRQALQADINRSLESLTKISETTSYNGQHLLSGEFSNREFQVGSASGETIRVTIGDIRPDTLGRTSLGSDQSTPASPTRLPSDLKLQSDSTTIQGSTLDSGSSLAAGTQIQGGSTLGFNLTDTALSADITVTDRTVLRAGSTLAAGSIIGRGTTVGGDIKLAETISTAEPSTLASASTLITGSTLAAGSRLSSAMTINGNSYLAGETLANDITLNEDLTMSGGLALAVGSELEAGSTIAQGSTAGNGITLAETATMQIGTELTTGSVIADAIGTNLMSGSLIGGEFNLTEETAVTRDMDLATGSLLSADSTLAGGSTLGGRATIATELAVSRPMTLGAGSVLEEGTLLAKGTVLSQDTRIQGGNVLAAGTVLTGDTITEAVTFLGRDQTIQAGSRLAIGSTLAPSRPTSDQMPKTNTIGDAPLSLISLTEIDVTGMAGAQDAIKAADQALTQLNRTRADLGSTQNRLISGMANLSVTMVNTAAAESTLADLDFAEESTNLATFRILQKAQIFAQVQAGNVKGANIMSLLQG
ncbi:MAG: hypothetical protein KJ950_16240 [Proteobacteria bacterium]|nr:hypothetical protein [Pseudomonadota bacterium]MBU1685881.1 hypothetical protein [Pseudomonadota bacterium]